MFLNFNGKADPVFLPTGKSSFRELRAQHKIYVDKTEMIWALARDNNCYFFSRPRRFGKTLLLSTFESLFKYGLKDFKGLAIEKLWTDKKTYPVIRLDFSQLCCDLNDLKSFQTGFEILLSDALSANNLELPPKKMEGDKLSFRFSRLLEQNSAISPVLLIDEYDAPVNYCLDKQALCKQISNELSSFYAMLKRQSSRFRFMFVTGICKYGTIDIFSSGSFIQDLSLSTKYGSLLGYTKQEVEKYFTPYIENAAKVLHLNFDECFDKMLGYYDGFCFEMYGKQHVFNPWSVLNFLSKPEDGFRNYWYKSSGKPTILEQYIKKHSLKEPEDYGKDLLVSLDRIDCNQDLDSISDVAMLNQTGYLTIKEAKVESDAVILNYPNYEVSKSMAQLFTDKVFSGQLPQEIIGETAWDLFGSGEIKDIVAKLNRIFLAIDYQRYPVKDEASVRSHLQMYLTGSNIQVNVEKHNAKGHSDLEFKVKDRYWVIELKFAKEQDSPQKLLNEAVEQLKSRQYGEQNETKLQHIRLALVFSQKDRQFVKFEYF